MPCACFTWCWPSMPVGERPKEGHHPDCENRTIKVAVVRHDGTACTVPLEALADMVEDGSEYTVQVKTMPLREFEAMPEFAGF